MIHKAINYKLNQKADTIATATFHSPGLNNIVSINDKILGKRFTGKV